jgi:hypothetical protein
MSTGGFLHIHRGIELMLGTRERGRSMKSLVTLPGHACTCSTESRE